MLDLAHRNRLRKDCTAELLSQEKKPWPSERDFAPPHLFAPIDFHVVPSGRAWGPWFPCFAQGLEQSSLSPSLPRSRPRRSKPPVSEARAKSVLQTPFEVFSLALHIASAAVEGLARNGSFLPRLGRLGT